jgi:fermentation-respiration switch protein FrsA (DUF1100 family)
MTDELHNNQPGRPNPPETSDSEKPPPAETGRRRFGLLRKRLVIYPLIVLLVYGAWLTLLYSTQDTMMFPRRFTRKVDGIPAIGRAEILSITIPSGEKAEAWYLRAEEATQENPRPLIVFFHGNAELIDDMDMIISMYRRLGCSLLLPEYRGYGRSGGKPSEAGIVSDAIQFHDKVANRPEVDKNRIIFHGRSLGSAVAASLARHRPPKAMILVAPFISAVNLAHKYGAPGFLLKSPFRTDEVLAKLDIPILLFHGTRDTIIPIGHSRTLEALAPSAKLVEYTCSHNDFPGDENASDYKERLKKFIESLPDDESPTP